MGIGETTFRNGGRGALDRRLALAACGAALLLGLARCDDAPAGGGGGRDRGGGAEHDSGGAHPDEVRLTSEAVERYSIRVAEAQRWLLRPTFAAPGRVAFDSDAMAHVGSPLRGWVARLDVRLGTRVKAGDSLLVVESPDLGEAQSDYLVRRSAAETAAPAIDLARSAWERALGLYETAQGISLTEVQRREAEYKTAVAALKAAQTTAMAAENRLHLLGMKQGEVETLAGSGEVEPRFVIRAPLDGEVVQREVTMGELVGPEREALLVIADTSTVWVLADVPENRLRQVALGARAWVHAGGEGGVRLDGAVSYISPIVDAATRSAQVRIDVEAVAVHLKPGMFVRVEITAADPDAADPEPVVAVPEESVQTVKGGPAIFVPVPGEENTFALRPVSAGKPVGGLVPVYAGLVEGERFVASGSFILKAELGKGAAEHQH